LHPSTGFRTLQLGFRRDESTAPWTGAGFHRGSIPIELYTFGVLIVIFRNASIRCVSMCSQISLHQTKTRFVKNLGSRVKSPWKITAIVLFWLAVYSLPLLAQLDMNHDTGVKSEESYDRANENVNIGGGNLNVVLPLAQLPGRNGHGFTLGLTYNSQQWTPSANYTSPGTNNYDAIYIGWSNEQPWQINLPILYMNGVTQFSGTQGNANYSQWSCWQNFALIMGDGSRYAFPNAAADCWQTTTSSYMVGASYETNPFQQIEHLIDTDGSTGNSSGGGGVSSNIQHALLDLTNFANNIATVRLTDGSQIIFSLGNNGLSQSPNGQIRMLASALVDANGNVTTISQTGNNVTISDANNNAIILNQLDANYIPQSIQYNNSSGQPQTIYLNSQVQTPPNSPPTPLFTAPAIGGNITAGGTSVNSPAIDNIVLAKNLSYTFQYNEYGELLKITYPSGGYTRYEYDHFPYAYYVWNSANEGYADRRDVVAKHVCRYVVTSTGTTSPSGYVGSAAANNCFLSEEDNTTYVRTPTTATLVDPLTNKTFYEFNAFIPVYPPNLAAGTLINAGATNILLETSHTSYQGGSTPVSKVDTVYVDPNTGNSSDEPFSKTTTLYPSGVQSQIQWTRDYSIKTYNPVITDRGISVNGTYGIQTANVLEERDYDFASAAPGALLRRVDSTWLTTNPINSVDYQSSALFILNKPLSETTYDSTGQIAQTQYEYDKYMVSISPSGAVQHGISTNTFGTAYTTRGNLTAVTRWRNTDGALLTNRNYQFDDAGNVLIKTDPAGHQTKYSFVDVWSDATCVPLLNSGHSAAYPTTITNALGQSTLLSYNSCTGTLGTSTDPNHQTTTFGYDSRDRRVSTTYPAGNGNTCLQYSDAPNSLCPPFGGPTLPMRVISSQQITASVSKVSTIVLDGLARQVQSQLNSDPWGTDYVDTTYDGIGNVSSVSNPYRLMSELTYGVTTYSYDALGRKSYQCQPDNGNNYPCVAGSSYLEWSYNGNVTTYSDELLNTWQRTSDALGRLTDVSEPGNLKTHYSYSGTGDLRSVTQSGLSSETARIRSFTYDSLSQMVCASNPENSSAQCPSTATAAPPVGVVSYGYDLSGNVITKTDARSVSINYGYDVINRLISKTYSSSDPSVGYTSSSCYIYDQNSTPNATGRLVAEWTQVGACPNNAVQLPSSAISWKNITAYDSMGRVRGEQQCPLAPCANPTTLSYTYDQAGDLASSTNGMPSSVLSGFLTTYNTDSAGRLSKIFTNWDDATHPPTLFEADQPNAVDGVQYAPYGPLGLTEAQYGVDPTGSTTALLETRTYDLRRRLITKNILGTSAGRLPTIVTFTMSQTTFTTAENPPMAISVSCDSACGQVTLTVDGHDWIPAYDVDGNGNYYDGDIWYWQSPYLTPGIHTITANYLGNSTYAPSSMSVIVTIKPIGMQQTSVTLSMSESAFTTVEDAVASVNVGCDTACGQIQFTVDGNQWATWSLDANGNTSIDTYWWPSSYFTLGIHTIAANYLGNSTYAPSSASQTITINPVGTQPVSVTLSAEPMSFSTSDDFNFPVQVGCNYACGLVMVTVDGNQWASLHLDDNGGGIVGKSWAGSAYFSPGPHTVTAHYLGNSTYAPNDSSVIVTVTP
jgi:YD repeat-containing protein